MKNGLISYQRSALKKFSLIICTYQRPAALNKLLKSLEEQEEYPQQVLIIDGSVDEQTRDLIRHSKYPNLEYYKLDEEDRGLTKQRNFGVMKVKADSEIICFLDDDIVLTPTYFKNLLDTYRVKPDATGVGGYILDEVNWEKGGMTQSDEFEIDGYKRKLGSRNLLRKRFGLLSDQPPGIMPAFSNGFSTGFLPPSGKTYPVEFFMGGVASYKKELFQKIKFSSYFEGYGLYEDMDFCLRASRIGQLYVNTAAQLYHYHEEAGRPNRYTYGKMVIRNGWYVWRVKYPNPKLRSRLKWHAIAVLLTLVRMANTLTTNKKREAFTESLGRVAGWWGLLFTKPRHEA